MNLVEISNRVELTFWNYAISFMEDQRAFRRAVISFAFVVLVGAASMFSLAMSSINLGPSDSSVAVMPDTETSNLPNGAANGQHNTLIIIVDYLGDGTLSLLPRLEGLWLTAYLPAMPHLTFLPLFPAALQGGAAVDAQLEEAFYMQPDGVPSQEFFNLLHMKGIHWNNFIIMDRDAITSLLQISGLAHSLNGFGDRTQAGIFAQAVVADRICGQASVLIQSAEPAMLAEQLSDHLYTDFGWPQLVAGWYQIRQKNINFSCEFPTLQGEFLSLKSSQ